MSHERPRSQVVRPSGWATKQRAMLVGTALTVSALVGCGHTGPVAFGQGSVATAGLSKSNFRMVKSNVRGDSYGFRFLGFIPIVPARVADAKEDLYEKLYRSGVQMEGRSIALANATEDENHYYFIIGSVPRITLTADIIEFLDDRAGQEKRTESAPARAQASGALMPSSILEPSTLNSPPQTTQPASPPPAPKPSAQPSPPTTKTPSPPTMKTPPPPTMKTPLSPSGVAPLGTDPPIAEFDLPSVTPLGR